MGLGKPADYFLTHAQGAGAQPRSPSRKDCSASAFRFCHRRALIFLTVDLSPLGLNETDEAFCRRIVTDYKVAAIPVSGVL